MRNLIRSAAIGLALAAATPALAAFDFSSELVSVTEQTQGNYSFVHGGWDGGGVVTGTFSGFDDDEDGQLDSDFGEITDFSMNWSGNAFVAPFSFGYENLVSLVYDLDGGPLGDGLDGFNIEGIAAFGYNTLYGIIPNDDCGCTGPAFGVVANVPEPASWTMLIAGFGLTGASMRRRRAQIA